MRINQDVHPVRSEQHLRDQLAPKIERVDFAQTAPKLDFSRFLYRVWMRKLGQDRIRQPLACESTRTCTLCALNNSSATSWPQRSKESILLRQRPNLIFRGFYTEFG